MKKLLLTSVLALSSTFGIGIGNYQITPEIGVNLSYQDTGDYNFTYGGYGRVWLGVSRIVIAPQVKYDVINNFKDLKHSYKNLQAGALLGFEVPILPLTPYIGMSYYNFEDIGYNDTLSLNYGIKIDIPLIPFLTIGLDGTFQMPKITGTDSRQKFNRIGATIGLAF